MADLKLGVAVVWFSMALGCFCGRAAGQTDWSAPVTIAAKGATSVSLVTAPKLASRGDGTAALVWHGHWGVTTGTAPHIITGEHHSDVYASYTTDAGTTWTPAQLLSDPLMLSTEAGVLAGTSGEYRFWCTSGDEISGYRLHEAWTTNGGVSVTTLTTVQDVFTSHVGFFKPAIAMAGPNLVLLRDVARHEKPLIDPTWPIISTRAVIGNDWTETSVPEPDIELVQPTIRANQNIAAAGSDVLIPITTVVAGPVSPTTGTYAIKTMISRDSGFTWQQKIIQQTLSDRPPYGRIATDGIGTWLMFLHFPRNLAGSGGSRTHMLRSTDAGETWSPEQLILRNDVVTDPRSAVTDGLGRWVVFAPHEFPHRVGYVWSDDNGGTWSELSSMAVPNAGTTGFDCAYLGNGRWGLAWTDGEDVKMSTLIWGLSRVDSWELY